MIYLSLYNNSEIKIDTNDENVLRKIRDNFTFYEPDYYFSYKYKSGLWDGKSTIFNTANRTIPYGLFLELYKFLKIEGYSKHLSIDDDLKKLFVNKFDVKFEYDLKFYPYYYQQEAVETLIKRKRGAIIHPTGSGKSLVITYLITNLQKNGLTKKHLVIVPNLSLVKQFTSDMVDYGLNKDDIGIIGGGKKQFDKPVTISTWQSLKNNLSKIKHFDMAICDELHGAKAKTINKIMKTCSQNMEYVFGCTGTLPSNDIEKLRVLSYIGPVWHTIKSTELSKKGFLAKCLLKQIKIKYKGVFSKGDYNERKLAIIKNEYRLQILKSIVNNVNNLLILVERIEDEGEFVTKYLKDNIQNREIVFLSGKDNADTREQWRKTMETDKDVIVVASYGIFSTGINVKSLKNIILLVSSKSKIRVLQSIGRALRKSENKEGSHATIWDFWDLIKNFKDHGKSRDRYYINEGFETQIIEMDERLNKNLNKLFE